MQKHYNFKSFLILLIIKLLGIRQLFIFDDPPSYISQKKVSRFKWFITKLKNINLIINYIFLM